MTVQVPVTFFLVEAKGLHSHCTLNVIESSNTALQSLLFLIVTKHMRVLHGEVIYTMQNANISESTRSSNEDSSERRNTKSVRLTKKSLYVHLTNLASRTRNMMAKIITIPLRDTSWERTIRILLDRF